jgi:hypothetical protein
MGSTSVRPPPQNLWLRETPIGLLPPGFSARFDTFGGRRLSHLKSRPGKEPFVGVNSDLPSCRAGAEPAPRFSTHKFCGRAKVRGTRQEAERVHSSTAIPDVNGAPNALAWGITSKMA